MSESLDEKAVIVRRAKAAVELARAVDALNEREQAVIVRRAKAAVELARDNAKRAVDALNEREKEYRAEVRKFVDLTATVPDVHVEDWS